MKANSSHPLLHIAGWSAYASGVVAVSGLLPFVTSFAFGVNIPRLNDSAATVQYLLALPIILALHQFVRAPAPVFGKVTMWLGIVGICSVAVVQILWLFESVGVTTYYLLIGTAFLMIGAWLVNTGCFLGRSTGTPRRSLLISILAATYVAYPIWALWLGRLLLSDKLAMSGPAMGGEIARV